MIKYSKDLPIEKYFIDGLDKAIKNHEDYRCIINGRVYRFFKNTRNDLDYSWQTPAEYDDLCDFAHEMAATDCK